MFLSCQLDNGDITNQVRGGGGATFGISVSATFKARPPMSIGYALFAASGKEILGMNDTRKIITALASVAPSLGDLGVGGFFSANSGSPGAYLLFVLPGGDGTSLANGEPVKSLS